MRAGLLAIPLALCVFTGWCYAVRPDSCAAVTLMPVWAWPIPGLLLVAAGRKHRLRRIPALVALAWVAYLLALAEEPKSLARGWVGAALPNRQGVAEPALCIVSLNCAGGSSEAMEEAAGPHPDIVLLQETPARQEVARFARRLFGPDAGVAWGPDTSIISRFPTRQVALPPRVGVNLCLARLRLAGGMEIAVGSMRLVPPDLQGEPWSPRFWRAQTENRRARREQLTEILPHLWQVPEATPLILGGDLNAPADDGALRMLGPRLRDTFREGGVGWGNTVLNDVPVLRFDQVWASRHFRAEAVSAQRTLHSDHRMVVCRVVAGT